MSEGHDLSLTREQIIGLLAELGQELDASGVKAQLFVVGGAAMALAYNMRRTTADVDGVFEPKAVIYEAARRVADRHEKLPADWLAHGEVAPAGPALTGRPVVDALVAAGTAHLARLNEAEAPAWTQDPARILPSFWHPGSDRFFAYSLAHAPAEFAARGILIEQDSLVSV